jgi:hypothetical protein
VRGAAGARPRARARRQLRGRRGESGRVGCGLVAGGVGVSRQSRGREGSGEEERDG